MYLAEHDRDDQAYGPKRHADRQQRFHAETAPGVPFDHRRCRPRERHEIREFREIVAQKCNVRRFECRVRSRRAQSVSGIT